MGNFEYDARQSDVERLFGKYGKIERVDMKSGKHGCCSILMLLHLKAFHGIYVDEGFCDI